jgi:hypothetical protein|tara:strand:- start:81 stop:788 length:708 start_codon:yes stop_codon:yes gene_type:complete
MRKYYIIILSALLAFSCDNNKIKISKVEGSPKYEDAALVLNELNSGSELEFSFDVKNYELGAQTEHEFQYSLANSKKGQHIHLIINNNPYSAHYTNKFKKKLDPDNGVILAFLSRSYHESVKNKNAYIFTQYGDLEKIDLDKQYLFYSRPKGTYTGQDTKKLLLDFYLINTTISKNGNKVRATINDEEFLIDEWSPYYIEGLPKGEVKIKLELINSSGELIDSPFNPSIRTVILN